MPESPEFISTGEAVCWLDNVCEECGALVEARPAAECWRCGARIVAGE